MKKAIYRKLLADCIKFFLLILFTISTIIWVLQAVNFLDFVIEDGHGFFVYFNYTILSFPKILSAIYPFAIFLSFSHILLDYEDKNELIIFWNFGIEKFDFIKFFTKISFFFVLLNLLLNAIITPMAQDKARSFIRSSDLDFFESALKPKKFVDVFKNLTIYFEEKNEIGELRSIFINDTSQSIIAEYGKFEIRGKKKILVLYNGKTIKNTNNKISEFDFSKTDFNISNFSTQTVTQQKIQETSTQELVICSLILNKIKKDINNTLATITNCSKVSLENIYKEIYVRLIKPLYITFLITISLLLIVKSKIDLTFKFYRFKIYTLGFLFIIFLESSSKLVTTNILQNLILAILPIFLIFTIYLYFLIKFKVNKI